MSARAALRHLLDVPQDFRIAYSIETRNLDQFAAQRSLQFFISRLDQFAAQRSLQFFISRDGANQSESQRLAVRTLVSSQLFDLFDT
jgi:hypothetical protein